MPLETHLEFVDEPVPGQTRRPAEDTLGMKRDPALRAVVHGPVLHRPAGQTSRREYCVTPRQVTACHAWSRQIASWHASARYATSRLRYGRSEAWLTYSKPS